MSIPAARFEDIYNTLVISVLTAITIYVLHLSDQFLARTVSQYHPIESYTVAAVIFFVVSHLFSYLAKRLLWINHYYFLLGAVAVVFPLVVLASIIQISFGMSGAQYLNYRSAYCDSVTLGVHTSAPLCGQAFAYVVYSMTIRALPIVLIIPFLYRLLIVDVYQRLFPKNHHA